MIALLVRLSLRAYPRRFRAEHEAELLEQINTDRAAVAGFGVVTFWLSTLGDLLRAAVRLRRAQRHAPNAPRFSNPRSTRPGRGEQMNLLLQDFRHASRSLLGAPTLSLIIIATLALGIGMNTSIFSMVNAALLQPLPYGDPERLVRIAGELPIQEITDGPLPGGVFAHLRGGTETLDDVAAFWNIQQNLTGIDVPAQVQVGWVSPNFFTVLHSEAFLGRPFAPGDGPGTAMLSHSLWRNSFFEDSEVVGRTVMLDGVPLTVVGVLPPDFRVELLKRSTPIDIWKTPDATWANGDVWDPESFRMSMFTLIGRMATDSNIERVQAELDGLSAGLRERAKVLEDGGFGMTATALRHYVGSDMRQTLLTLFGAVGFVLLIACANVVNLLLVRARGRTREIGLRMAIGAPRTRIVRLLLVESLLLAALGSVGGLVLGVVGNRAFAALRPAELPRLDGVALDLRVLAFVGVTAIACTVLVGLAPALVATNRRVNAELRSSRGTTGGEARLTRGLVVVQIALSLVLLIGAGLLTGSLMKLQKVDAGFATQRLLSFSISLPGTRYTWPEGTNRFFRELENRLEAMPGIESAGVVWPLPLTGGWGGVFSGGEIEPESKHVVGYRVVTPGFFETVSIPLVQGRVFESSDPGHTVIVSARLAERAWPEGGVVGRTLQANPWGRGPEDFQIVGIAGDVRYESLTEPASETVYFDARSWSWVDWEVDFAVRATGDPLALVDPVRQEIAAMDAEVPMAEVRPLVAYVSDELAPTRFALVLVGLFAAVAALLAVIGLYGVLSYSVVERTREIGVRMALGSDRGRILGMVVGQGVRLTVVGLVAGVLGAMWLTRFLSSFLFEVETTDPWTFGLVALSLALVGTFAAYLPARRATRCDPMAALRTE